MIELVILGKNAKGKIAIIDDDKISLSKYKWYANNYGYPVRYVKHTTIFLHNDVMGKEINSNTVDHINRNPMDNRKENLRTCTISENRINSNKKKTNTSGYKGVTFFKRDRNWRAQIGFNNKIYHIGYFETKIEAAKAYNNKAKELFNDFAFLNQI